MSERDDWEELIGSPGYQRWVQYAKTQYGPKAHAEKLTRAALSSDPAQVTLGVQVVIKVAEEMNGFLNYPAERVAFLRRQEEQDAAPLELSRRGTL